MKVYFLAILVEARHIRYSFNKRTSSIEESLHVSFDEHFDKFVPSATNNDDIMQIESLTDLPSVEKEEELENIPPKPLVEVKDHPHD